MRCSAALAALAATVALGPLPCAAAASATTACANPRLPRSILDGDPASPSGAPLQVVDVVASGATLRTAVADTPALRERGLMCVTALRQSAGMIFVFPSTHDWDFWMKNTLVPLDMVWIDDDGRIRTIARNVPASTMDEPEDRVARRTGFGRYVIELRAGEADRLGLHGGERLTVPRLHADE